MEADVFVKLDAVFTRYVEQQAWQQAVQNRMTAASIAHRHGRTDLFNKYLKQAIALADKKGLERLELDARIQGFTYWLMQDLSGKRQDELGVELSYKLNLNDAPEPSGPLAEKLNDYSKSALDAYKELISNLHQSGLSCKDSLLKDSLTLAKEKTIAFALIQLSGEFEEALDLLKNGKAETVTPEVTERIQTAAQQARIETKLICNSLRVDMCLLVAEQCRKLGDADTAEGLFKTAEQFSEDLPEKRVTLYMTWADYYDGQGQIQKAIDYANKANEAAGQISMDALKEQAAGKLNTLLARGKTVVLESHGPGFTERVMSALDQAHQFFLASRFEDSLKSCEIALEQAISPQLRRAVLREREIALYELGRFTEVETDLNECISLISDELSSDQSVETGAFDQRILEEEDLYLMKAYLMAKIGRSTDSWVIAEQGRSHRLKQEIATSSDFPITQFEDANFDTIRDWLHSERAAMLCFGVTRWGTLALTAGPDDTEPTAQILDRFTGSKLEALLGKKLESQDKENSQASTPIILESIPGLSVGLIHPLSERLAAITQRARILYIVPDWFLYYAPFAALTLADHRMLIDLCPLAFTSSCTILRWSASRQMETTSQNCLAVAVGKDTEGYEFRNHLTQIGTVPWGQAIYRLEDDAATAAAVARLAPYFPVLYFVCHGSLDTKVRDIMAASQLKLAGAGEHPLTARDISQWKLQADLVFLNSCQSGRFRLKARTDVNGLVRAFILAGARSLIAPLIHVQPKPAGDLAQAFFQAWLTGANKAEALRKAQFAARQAADQKDKNLMDWATYRLFGYFR
jgi:hypothetical protein